MVFLCGLAVPDRDVLALAERVEERELELKLRYAVARGVKVLALNTGERETMLLSLDDPPKGLAKLRAVLEQEHARRVRKNNAAGEHRRAIPLLPGDSRR